MGLMDQFKKGGGGFLNNVDGVIVDYQFTDNPDFGGDRSARKESDFTSLWVKLDVQQDGSDAVESTHLFAGSADDFVISEDGYCLTPIDEAQLWGSTAFARLYGSMVERGLPDEDPQEDGTLDFRHMINWRYRFVQVKDEEAMQRAAKGAAKSKGKINAQGQKKGKDGTYYDIRTLEVSEVYGEADTKRPQKQTAKAGTTRGAAVKTVSKSKSKGTTASNGEAAIEDFARETLLDLLGEAKGNTLSKSAMNLAITRKLMKDDRREDVRKYLYDDATLEALAEEGIITYEKSGKQQTITAA